MSTPTSRRTTAGGFSPDGRPVTRVSKLATALVTALCVVVAGAAVQFGPVLTEQDIRRGVVGEPMQFYRATVTVVDVEPATQVADPYGDTSVKSKGLLLAVTVRMDAPEEEQRISADKLHAAEDMVFDSVDYGSMSVPAGFSGTSTFVYEVNPRLVDDLYLEVGDGAIFFAYPQVLQIDLGIGAENADAWARAGAGQEVEPSSSPELKAIP